MMWALMPRRMLDFMQITRLCAGVAAAVALISMTAGAARAADLVTTAASVAPKAVAPGGQGKLTITLTIVAGAHVNAHKLPDQDFIPTNFVPAGADGIKFAAAKYPAGHSVTTAGIAELVYEGSAKIVIPFTVAKTAKSGSQKIGGSLTFQACNTSVCFPPKTVSLDAPLTIK